MPRDSPFVDSQPPTLMVPLCRVRAQQCGALNKNRHQRFSFFQASHVNLISMFAQFAHLREKRIESKLLNTQKLSFMDACSFLDCCSSSHNARMPGCAVINRQNMLSQAPFCDTFGVYFFNFSLSILTNFPTPPILLVFQKPHVFLVNRASLVQGSMQWNVLI